MDMQARKYSMFYNFASENLKKSEKYIKSKKIPTKFEI